MRGRDRARAAPPRPRSRLPEHEPSTMTDDSLRDDIPSLDHPAPQTNGNGHDPGRPPRLVLPAAPPRSRAGSTEDEELFNRAVPPTPQPIDPELGRFTHTEPWRVLRIQAEFVYGINTLAEVGAAVAVFGSA